MTIAPISRGSAQHDDGVEGQEQHGHRAGRDAFGAEPVPGFLRSERLDTQVAQFLRGGYRVEQRSEFRAVVIREHRRSLASRVVGSVRTLGIVPVLMRAPRAYHRVLITVEADGEVRIL